MMTEAANILGAMAAILLLMAGIAWVKLVRGLPLHQVEDGIGLVSAPGEFAAEILFWAAGLSSSAVTLAIAGLMFA